MADFQVRPIGYVRSALTDLADASRQSDEGAPSAEIVLDEQYLPGLDGLEVGQSVVVLTWLHLADRASLTAVPRGDASRPETGVFGTRSPSRPNPIGLHTSTITAIEGGRVRLSGLEAVDGTPVLDVKPVLRDVAER